MARPRKNPESVGPWVVRDVPEDTRRKVRVYAAQHDLTMAQALERLLDRSQPGASQAPDGIGEVVRTVPEYVWQDVQSYAAERDMGMAESIIELIRKALEEPEVLKLRHILVGLYLELGRKAEAVTELIAIARYCSHYRILPEMITALEQAIALDARNTDAYDLLGWAYTYMGDHEQAQHMRQVSKKITIENYRAQRRTADGKRQDQESLNSPVHSSDE